MPARCFECQEIGHVVADCPWKNYAAELGDGKPPWCSQCDRETRLVYTAGKDGLKAHRCRNCHPKGESLPVQFRRCGACRTVIYDWDVRSECGKHQPVGKQRETTGARK